MRRPAELYAELDALANQLDELTRQMIELEGTSIGDMLIGDETESEDQSHKNSEH